MMFWTGELAQRLGALAALPEILNSIPSNHRMAHNHLEWNLPVRLKTAIVYSYTQNKYIFFKKNDVLSQAWWDITVV